MGSLVHGIVDGDTVPALSEASLSTTAGRRVRVVKCGDLAAVVTDCAGSEVLPSRANLLLHTRLLENIAAMASVLPMCFGAVVSDDNQLMRDVIDGRRDALRRVLDGFRGFIELRVRTTYVEHEVVQAVLQDDPPAARLRDAAGFEEKLRLGRRISECVDARRERDAQLILNHLAPHAADVASTTVRGGLDVLSASFLVASERRETFGAAVDDLADRLGRLASVALIGPMPPFSFVTQEY